jgi:hypothetical protein
MRRKFIFAFPEIGSGIFSDRVRALMFDDVVWFPCMRFAFSLCCGGSMRDEAGETLSLERHNPVSIFTCEEGKGEKRGLKRTSTHQSFNPPRFRGRWNVFHPEPCSADSVQAKFEILLAYGRKKAAETRLHMPPSNHNLKIENQSLIDISIFG